MTKKGLAFLVVVMLVALVGQVAAEPDCYYASIGDRVWLDDNRDGIQSPGEQGVARVRVTLCAADGTELATKLTNSDGLYRFNWLEPGDYFLEFTAPAGYEFCPCNAGAPDIDSDAGVDGVTVPTTLDIGEVDLTWDAGLILRPTAVRLQSISGQLDTDPALYALSLAFGLLLLSLFIQLARRRPN